MFRYNEDVFVRQESVSKSNKTGSELEHLISISSLLSREQILAIFMLSGENVSTSTECLLSGPNIQSIVNLAKNKYKSFPAKKLYIDSDVWCDLVASYKNSTQQQSFQLRICLNNQLCIDTGGVSRQIYKECFDYPIENTRETLSRTHMSSLQH